MQTLARICIERPVFAAMLTLSLIVLGGAAFLGLGVDLLPNIDLPVITVTVVNPGASPQEIESEITKKVEAAVSTVGGVEMVKSTSHEGLSMTVVTFELEKNGETAAQQIRDQISLITGLPPTAQPPVVQRLDAGAAPILQVALSADQTLEKVTRTAEERFQKSLEGISGVGKVQILGGASEEVRVTVSPEALLAHGVTVAEVVMALRSQNIEVPGGRLQQGGKEWTVRTIGRLDGLEQLTQISVARRGDRAVTLAEVAKVTRGSAERRTASLLNGKAAVTLVVYKQSGKNTVEVAKAVQERIGEIAAALGPGYRVETVSDQSVFIRAAVEAIEHHLLLGTLLAGLIVYAFLGSVRSTIIAGLAIPTSLIATFAMMSAVDYTLNQVTMLALALMIGIVIDDAIVVLENIFRFVEQKGMDPKHAAVEATREIGLAVLATTFSLMAVFLPIAFMKGIVGRIMSSFGLTSAFAVGISLFVSFSLTPMLCARLIRKESHTAGPSRFYGALERWYVSMLVWSMRHRAVVAGICVLVLVSTVPLFLMVKKNFTPTDDQSAFLVSVQAPEGSTLQATTLAAERIARDLRTLPGVVATLTSAGGGSSQQVTESSIFVKLAPIDERADSQDELMAKARQRLAAAPAGLHTSVQPMSVTGGAGNADIQYVVRGPDLATLSRFAKQLSDFLVTVPGATDIDSTLAGGKPSVFVEIDRSRAADLGVSVADIAQTLNTLVAGQEVSNLETADGTVPLRVQAPLDLLAGPDGLRRLTVPSSSGALIRLDNVAAIRESFGPASIERQDRIRSVTISANLQSGASQAAVVSAMENFIKTMNLPPGYTATAAGASKELVKAAYYFLLAVALAFIFMYLVLASQFESLLQPLIILATLPLSVPFGVLSLIVTGQSFNLFAALGMLLLFGVVKKNAILQLDHTNTLRAQGMPRDQAIVEANRDRLRPILMTTLALVAGMLPLVVSSGPGASTNRAIGAVVMGGQSLCLLLTLLEVPVLYSLAEDLRESRRLRQWIDRFRPARTAPEVAS